MKQIMGTHRKKYYFYYKQYKQLVTNCYFYYHMFILSFIAYWKINLSWAYSWMLLGDGQSLFIEGVTNICFPRLSRMVSFIHIWAALIGLSGVSKKNYVCKTWSEEGMVLWGDTVLGDRV